MVPVQNPNKKLKVKIVRDKKASSIEQKYDQPYNINTLNDINSVIQRKTVIAKTFIFVKYQEIYVME